MKEKKEIQIKKSLITLILKSVIPVIVILFFIQHFGEITTDNFASNPKLYFFENPINGDTYNTTEKLIEYPTYFEKVTQFYFPSIIGNFTYILIGSILLSGVFVILEKYNLKLS